MKILVLNGSPKGPTSVTMQYVEFMQKKNPQHDFEIIHIAQQIQQIEKSERFNESLWKTFFDRAFFNTHIPSLVGKQIAFFISGPLRQLPNLRQVMEAYPVATSEFCWHCDR